MATTMALSISTQSSLNALVPPPSQDFAVLQQQPVPDVFVIPPEEEQEDNPPWCYFDATQAAKESLITYPDIDALDVALGICQQTDNRAPSFNRYHSNESHETIVMPRRGNAIPRLRDMDLAFEDGQTDIRSRGGSTRSRDHRPFDEEIVEVVKVRRNEGMTDVGDGRTLKMKKSSTFRARATQALRSIKNVGKSSSSNRRATVSISEPKAKLPIHAQGAGGATLPSRHSCQDPPTPRAASPTVSRRRSLTLSQMFAFKEKENQTSRPASPMEAEPPSPITPSCEPAPASRPMSPTDNSSSHARRLQPSPSLEDCMATPTRSHSPNGDDPVKPSLSKRKSFRRRLSVLELQKLFSIGTHSQPNSAPVQDADEDLFSPSQSRPLSMDSTAILSSTSSRTSSVSLGEMSARRPSASSQRSSSRAGGDCSNIDEEDLEMRLDSLHFDSLHFDPDEIMSTL